MREYNSLWGWSTHLIMMIFSIACIVPFIVLFSSSISSSKVIIQQGYSIFPRDFDLTAYRYLLNQSTSILNALGVSAFVTLLGTSASLAISSLFAYPLARRDLPGRNFWSLFVVITLLFNGGLVPTYLVYTNVFNIKDTLFALIVPNLLMNGFSVLMMRTFIKTTIPESILESAEIDGAGEFRIFSSIILPLSLPVMAMIGLFTAIGYWNDWFNAMIYISRPQLLGLQAVLNQMINNINFLSTFTSSGGTVTPVVELPSTTVRMAIAFVGVLPFLLTYPFFQKYFVKGITVGAVKG